MVLAGVVCSPWEAEEAGAIRLWGHSLAEVVVKIRYRCLAISGLCLPGVAPAERLRDVDAWAERMVVLVSYCYGRCFPHRREEHSVQAVARDVWR